VARETYKFRSGITLPPVNPSTLTNPSEGDLVIDSTDSNKLKKYTSGSWVAVGGSTSMVGINYITNNNFEVNVNGYATYADAASAIPVDGSTGGSPTVTFVRSVSSPLVGTASGLFTKDAVNRQGEGFSYDFTIDSAYQAKPCTISFLYKVASGTYADNDMTVWIYDVTNAVLIQPSAYQIKNATGAEMQKCEFQTASNSTSYRLIVHVASTSASAYTVGFDQFSVSPNTYTMGSIRPPVGTIVQTSSVTPDAGFLYCDGTAVSRTTYATLFAKIGVAYGYGDNSTTFNLPDFRGRFLRGVTTDAARDPDYASRTAMNTGGNTGGNVGSLQGDAFASHSHTLGSGANAGIGGPYVIGSSPYTSTNATGGSETRPKNANVAFHICYDAGSVQMSSETDTRVVSMDAVKSGGSVTGSTIIPTWTVVNKDSHGAFNATTGIYTIPVAGDYEVSGLINLTTSASWQLGVIKNGTAVYYGPAIPGYVNATVERLLTNLVAGDQIALWNSGSGTVLTATSPYSTSFSIRRISGPAQIAASEKIYANYHRSADVSTTALNQINFDVKDIDTHGAVTTGTSAWKFTAPRPGVYDYNVVLLANGVTTEWRLYKNGAVDRFCNISSATNNSLGFSGFIQLNAGDYIDFRPSATGTTYGGSGTTNYSQVYISSQ